MHDCFYLFTYSISSVVACSKRFCHSVIHSVMANMKYLVLSHDPDTIHAEKGSAKMCDFCMAAVMFLTGHGIKARTHAHVEITHFPTQCITRTWKALSLHPRAS